MTSPLEERRYGRFNIPRRLLDTDYDGVLKVMSKCVVVRAEMLMDQDAIEYIAISSEFDPVEKYSISPEYIVCVDYGKEGEQVNTTFERL